ncbi:NUDIX hydrolase [Paenibacillus sp. UNC451MF]|uniref:NUDIX hydrolase n=1 Tax=Paenibacillus sp. UNC451MF TaxID=1449063 RepID=UPI0004913A65|nr:NUDIX hydrolase [Paenibacillus sp. UNC451MF]
MKRVDVALVWITDDAGNILIVKNVKANTSYWDLPGGAVEEGETLEQAAIRETREETGFNVVITGLSSLREKFFAKAGAHALIVTFFAKITDGEMNIYGDPDHDIAGIRWVDMNHARRLMPVLFDELRLGVDKPAAFYAFEGTR